MSQPDRPLTAATTLLPAEPSSPMQARRFARDTMSTWGLRAPHDEVVLVVNELVANALLHGAGPIALSLDLLGDVVRIEVVDDSPELPVTRPPSSTRTSGRGIALVEAIAHAWGARPHTTGGKCVWAEIPIARASS